jgi:hypothetical protein
MGKVTAYKGEDGQLHGYGETGERTMQAFGRHVEAMEPGDTISWSWLKPRNLKHHRKFFAKLHQLFEMQERFDHEDKLRTWLTIGAGYCDYYPGPGGTMVAVPQSIAFDSLDEEPFADLHRRIDAFLFSPYALSFLWPSVRPETAWLGVDNLLLQFEQR